MGHYIDDFVTVGRTASGECGRNLAVLKEVCAKPRVMGLWQRSCCPAAIWGEAWTGKTVRARCDNQVVVATVNSGSCRETEVDGAWPSWKHGGLSHDSRAH